MILNSLLKKLSRHLHGTKYLCGRQCQAPVERVRELGFDVFDDWVDHSYDLIDDYDVRMHKCLTAVDNVVQHIHSIGIQQVHQTLMPRFAENDVVLNRCRRRTIAEFDQGLKRLQLKGQL